MININCKSMKSEAVFSNSMRKRTMKRFVKRLKQRSRNGP